ncbi:C4-type zinc ribbon domain-containing protein [Desulfarculales bacterium]
MLDQIRLLVKLQVIDKVFSQVVQEQEALPAKLTALNLERDRLTQALAVSQSELEGVVTRRKNLEFDIETIRSRVNKAETRLMATKTQREFRTATAEIEEGREALKDNDDVLLELMERQESLEAQVKTLSEQLAKVSAEVAGQRKELITRAQELSTMISDITRDRTVLASQVEQSLISEYDFIRKARQGVALSAVRNGTCGVCHIDITPQQFNELQRVDKIMSCPSCKRLIYWGDAEALADL